MKREFQKKIKELENSIIRIVKENIKPYGFKTKSYMIWCVQNDFFFTLFPYIITPDDGCKLQTKIGVKPIYADDLLWDIMDMQSNKNQPLSLRAVGAFTVSELPIIDTKEKIESLELSELDGLIKCALKTFSDLLERIKGNEADWFYAEANEFFKHYKYEHTLKLIMLLHFEKYAEAKEYVNHWGGSGQFKNEGKSLHTRVIEYCNSRL